MINDRVGTVEGRELNDIQYDNKEADTDEDDVVIDDAPTLADHVSDVHSADGVSVWSGAGDAGGGGVPPAAGSVHHIRLRALAAGH